MKKTLWIFLLLCPAFAWSQTTIDGSVLSASDQQPLPGVNVIVKGSTYGTTTDADGRFALRVNQGDVLVFSFIGYKPQELLIASQTSLVVHLEDDIATLDEVTIVSTGYQEIPRDRATGSFAQLDNDLVNRRVSTDVLSRLEDVTSGLIFNRNIPGSSNDISIRGRSTIKGNASPLIVVDNFPYDGDLSNINPNDVESITVLKDAAAASIWGARAGNGVIVITTRKGRSGQPIQVSANANLTIGDRPDLFYNPRMSSSDFIDVEQMLFERDFYASLEASQSHAPLTPAVELFIAHRDGHISSDELQSQLSALRQTDVRNDYEKYLYRKSVAQQYAINLRGSTSNSQYHFSAGYDHTLDNMVGNDFRRVTMNAGNTWKLLRDKLDVTTAIYYTQAKRSEDNIGLAEINHRSGPMYPYAAIKDGAGNYLPLIKDYRGSYVESAQSLGLLPWHYNPLSEIEATDNTIDTRDYRVNLTARYAITAKLKAELLYQYWNANTFGRNLRSEESYYARNLINLFSQDNGLSELSRIIPEGGILDRYDQRSESHNVRGQITYASTWGDHDLSALGGYEVKEIVTDMSAFRYYGYDDELATHKLVNYINYYPAFHDPARYMIVPNTEAISSLNDRYVSYFANAAYTYRHRYTVSGSARKDQSNLFGVTANRRGVPLWSAGLSWVASEENFFDWSFMPYLRLRTTFGYNGNIDKSVTAYTTALSRGANRLTGLPYATIINPPNAELQWEKVRIWNTGIDFESRNRILSGSIEYFAKWGTDLIGATPFPPSTGVTSYTGNNANTRGYGIDVVLNSNNLNGPFKWTTTLLLSTVREKVTSYKVKSPAYSYVSGGAGSASGAYPLEGRPLYAVYSYDWAGLEPETGNPQGYIDGQVSTDYSTILSSATPESIRYHGSARPTAFGALRNTFSWKNISLSVNLSYRMGHYIKMRSVNYSTILNGYVGHGDYADRWQQPGDEAITTVPSMPASPNLNRDDFYLNSSALVEKGDHVRLQDINLTYTLDRTVLPRLPMTRMQLYLYLNNLGVIWRATDRNIDPDYTTMKPVRTIAGGLRIDF